MAFHDVDVSRCPYVDLTREFGDYSVVMCFIIIEYL